MLQKPTSRPLRPFFSSGPCAKRPGWNSAALEAALLGRSHRSKPAKARLAEVINLSRDILAMPEDWRLGIVPASDTGAVEMALWSLLGPRAVDVLAFENFSTDWAKDVTRELKLDARIHRADYGMLPDLSRVDWSHDVVLAWNGTTSGVRLPMNTIPARHEGLAICDATSAVFAMHLPWERLDVVTWSWQKVLGGEAGHGMLALGPRAIERLVNHRPAWPMPKIFRLVQDGRLIESIFRGETINTPSMLAVEDQLDALRWAEGLGGLPSLIERTEANFRMLSEWVRRSAWAGFLAEDEGLRSPTSVCLKFTDAYVLKQPLEVQSRIAAGISEMLEREGVAYDINAYRDAPPGLRIWCGATIEADDVGALLAWLDWAFAVTLAQARNAA